MCSECSGLVGRIPGLFRSQRIFNMLDILDPTSPVVCCWDRPACTLLNVKCIQSEGKVTGSDTPWKDLVWLPHRPQCELTTKLSLISSGVVRNELRMLGSDGHSLHQH